MEKYSPPNVMRQIREGTADLTCSDPGRALDWICSIIGSIISYRVTGQAWSMTYPSARFTAANRSSDLNGLTTWPLAPCCCPQNLSLSCPFDVHSTIGMPLNLSSFLRSRQA